MRAFLKQPLRVFKPLRVFNKLSVWPRGGFLLIGLVLVALCVLGVSNLWLSSSWGGNTAEYHLKKRTGLDWEVGGAKWSPWNGLTMNNVRAHQPEGIQDHLNRPLVSVGVIQVTPDWRGLLKGKAEPREVVVTEPRVTVSVEMLAAMAKQYKEPLKAQKPKPSTIKKKPNTKPPPSSEPKQEASKVAPKPIIKKKTQPQKIKKAAAGLPLWLKVNNANLEVISIHKKKAVLSVSGLSLDTPIFGEDAEGRLKINDVTLMGQPLLSNINEVVQWQRPFLKIKNDGLSFFGLELQLQAQMAIDKKALKAMAFQFSLHVKPQPLGEVHLLERFGMTLDADLVTGGFRGSGYVADPLSWRGSARANANGLHVKERHGGNAIKFDEVSVPAVFHRGQLRWGGLRAIGEDVSILGNGSLSSSGGILAVTRLVVSPEVALNINRAMLGAMIPNVTHSWWGDLDTPDRKVRDLTLSGHVSYPMVDITRKHEPVPVWEIVTKAQKFIRREMKEEGKVLQPSGNHEMFKKQAHENH